LRRWMIRTIHEEVEEDDPAKEMERPLHRENHC
jgi:hypothetical protein